MTGKHNLRIFLRSESLADRRAIVINEEVLEQGARSLQGRAAALKGLRFTKPIARDFKFSELRNGLTKALIRDWLDEALGDRVKHAAIYKITAADLTGAAELQDAFDQVRKSATFKLPRRNEFSLGQTVYVGSSRNIVGRLFEHLQQAASKTYALHLGRWCPEGPHSLAVEIQQPVEEPEVTAIQDAENVLWDRCRPMFGRRGAR
jgi:hypothetical protein